MTPKRPRATRRSRSAASGRAVDRPPQVSLPIFALAAVVLVSAAAIAEQTGALDWLRYPTARASHAVVSAMGFRTTLVGCEIFTRSKILDVAVTCIPSGVLAVLIALVIATRTSWPKRALGAAIGAAVLFAANVARVIVGVMVAQAAPAAFDVVHHVVLQVIPVLSAFLAWLVWARWSRAI